MYARKRINHRCLVRISLPSLLFPHFPSPTLSYSLSPSPPSTLSSHQLPTPPHPFLTLLPYSPPPCPSPPLPSPTIHSSPLIPSPDVSYPAISPPISSPPLGHPILPSRPSLSHFLPFPRDPSALLPYLSSHLLPSYTLPTPVFPTIRSTRISSPLAPYPALSSHPLPYLFSTLPYPSGQSRGRKVSFSTLL